MAIISIINQKGGVAKTTTALHLAYAMAEKEVSVVVYDVDPQGSATALYNDCSKEWGYEVRPRQKKSIQGEIRALSEQFDVVIVDTRPDLGKDTMDVLAISELVIVPVFPGGNEIRALTNLSDKFTELAEVNPNVVLRGLVVGATSRFILTRQLPTALEQIDILPFNTQIMRSEIFNQITVSAQLVFEVKKNTMAKKAAHRYRLLTKEVIDQMIEIRTKGVK